MRIPTPLILLSALGLAVLAAPVPQEGNNQIDEFNVSPTPSLPAATAAPTAAAAPTPAADPFQPPPKPKIDAKDGMAAGMGAAMSGLGQATSALQSLPLVGGLGGLGGRSLEKRRPLLEVLQSLPLLGALAKMGGKVKRGAPAIPAASAMYPKLSNLPDTGSAGFINLGGNSKREAEPQVEALKALPVVGSVSGLIGNVKRQLDVIKGLPLIGGLLGGGKVKREAAPQLDALKGLPIVGGIVGGQKAPKAKRTELGIDGIKKVVAEIADIRGVTSKRSPEEGDFRQELRKANKAKVGGELSKAADKAERKVKIKNTKFPPGGGRVKSPQEALDKREESEAVVEKRGGLDTLPVKDIAESMTGLKSALDLLKSANAAFQGANGK